MTHEREEIEEARAKERRSSVSDSKVRIVQSTVLDEIIEDHEMSAPASDFPGRRTPMSSGVIRYDCYNGILVRDDPNITTGGAPYQAPDGAYVPAEDYAELEDLNKPLTISSDAWNALIEESLGRGQVIAKQAAENKRLLGLIDEFQCTRDHNEFDADLLSRVDAALTEETTDGE